jgi:hypothetical protein
MTETNINAFKVINRDGVPTGRHGKHRDIVTQILDNLEGLSSGQALKIPLSDLPDSKVNIRSALSRATRKLGINVTTAADEEYLYVWNS